MKPGAVGLPNPGGEQCYVNAVLQCLLPVVTTSRSNNISKLLEGMSHGQVRIQSGIILCASFSYPLTMLVITFFSFAPDQFDDACYQSVVMSARARLGSGQQDAHEFLLLECFPSLDIGDFTTKVVKVKTCLLCGGTGESFEEEACVQIPLIENSVAKNVSVSQVDQTFRSRLST